MFQSPLAQFPSIAQFSKARRTPLSAARLASAPHTVLKRGRLVFDRLAADAPGEAGDGLGAEEMRVVDQRFPAGQRPAVEIAFFERIAEHAERVDRRRRRRRSLPSVRVRVAADPASIVCQKKGSMLSKPSFTSSRT